MYPIAGGTGLASTHVEVDKEAFDNMVGYHTANNADAQYQVHLDPQTRAVVVAGSSYPGV